MATYADIIAPGKASIIPVDADGGLGQPTSLIRDARAVGLKVMPWTFRPENAFLPPALRQGHAPEHRAEISAVSEILAFLEAGVDGCFTDDPAIGRAALSAWNASSHA
jgi:glycerophosphoryl diester phosphodiesterase